MDNLTRDLRYALRTLRRSPLFVTVAAVTLALGIGVNATIFTFGNSILLRPLPVENPDELMAVFTSWPEETYATSSYTTASMVSVLSGLLPQEHRVRQFDQLVPEEVRLITEILPADYQFAAVVSNAVLSDGGLGIADRFDHYDEEIASCDAGLGRLFDYRIRQARLEFYALRGTERLTSRLSLSRTTAARKYSRNRISRSRLRGKTRS